MKNKKLMKKRVGIFLLMIVFCACLIINYSENYFSFSKKITYQKSELEDNELKTLNKLEKDLAEFKRVGALKITEDNMFYPTHKSQISERMLEVALEGTDLKGNAHSFIKVEKKYGVNALYLLAIANHESDFGQSRIAKDKNNLFGFNAVDSDPYNGASQYNSLDEGIQDIGKKIKILYLSDNGKYFKGYNSYAMNKNYASDKNWGEKVNNHMILIAEKILSSYK
ncbi:MAG: glucosaminidase domain-containing protein [Finegoldia magna]